MNKTKIMQQQIQNLNLVQVEQFKHQKKNNEQYKSASKPNFLIMISVKYCQIWKSNQDKVHVFARQCLLNCNSLKVFVLQKKTKIDCPFSEVCC